LDYSLGTTDTEIDPSFQITVDEAVRFFLNPTGLPDGSAMYVLLMEIGLAGLEV
jgi:hypothetical protein